MDTHIIVGVLACFAWGVYVRLSRNKSLKIAIALALGVSGTAVFLLGALLTWPIDESELVCLNGSLSSWSGGKARDSVVFRLDTYPDKQFVLLFHSRAQEGGLLLQPRAPLTVWVHGEALRNTQPIKVWRLDHDSQTLLGYSVMAQEARENSLGCLLFATISAALLVYLLTSLFRRHLQKRRGCTPSSRQAQGRSERSHCIHRIVLEMNNQGQAPDSSDPPESA